MYAEEANALASVTVLAGRVVGAEAKTCSGSAIGCVNSNTNIRCCRRADVTLEAAAEAVARACLLVWVGPKNGQQFFFIPSRPVGRRERLLCDV